MRRYGLGEELFLERKTKAKKAVKKKRIVTGMLPLLEVSQLPVGPGIDPWFALQLNKRRLQPTCTVSYERIAYIGESKEGPIRFTLDRNAQGRRGHVERLEPLTDGVNLLDGEAVVELKFMNALPSEFKELLESLQLQPRSLSKYRRCVERCGLLPGPTAAPG